MDLVSFITALTTLLGLLTSVRYARRAKKAEVKAQEAEARAKEIENRKNDIGNAELMIELVQKANAEAAQIRQSIIDTLKFENEKFKKYVERLEKALNSIRRCAYRDKCPVYAELPGLEGRDEHPNVKDRDHPGSDPGYLRQTGNG